MLSPVILGHYHHKQHPLVLPPLLRGILGWTLKVSQPLAPADLYQGARGAHGHTTRPITCPPQVITATHGHPDKPQDIPDQTPCDVSDLLQLLFSTVSGLQYFHRLETKALMPFPTC